ncbi:MAG: baseplate J/gp47 family protein [Acidobacteria bacterium]|nr:baseplate J/gp47 family protein [Acidobacteriota bacterium]MBV9478970.1 baseplate J/gp47 family protein [Acidobacteriota bacterium]
MPITLPNIDDRRYDDLVGEALARIPVHTPEWTNFNRSDPGVTLIEVFAFLTESLLYRANQIPERNRKKFLQLLRIPLQTATAARGLVTIANSVASTTPDPVVLTEGIEVRAGEVPFRSTRAVDVLPVEGRVYFKKKITDASPDVKKYYQQLYASYRGTPAEIEPQLYEATPFPTREGTPVALSDTIDNGFWLALMLRDVDVRSNVSADLMRTRIANRTLTLGVVPSLTETQATLPSGRAFATSANVALKVEAPKVPDSGGLPDDIAQRRAEYRPLDVKSDSDILAVPGVVDIALPDASSMRLWNNIDPLEAGVNELPPALDDPALEARVVTWLKITLTSEATASFLWMGINTVPVTQSARVLNELLPDGTGEPDQVVRLALAPVLPESVSLTVTHLGTTTPWTETDDLATAGAEVPLPDPRIAPGAWQRGKAPSNVFLLDAESGDVRFGDGEHGARPPAGATLRASYAYSLGAEGNVGVGAINSSPALPEGFKVANPIATWGGAEAETVAQGEKQISRYLQHRDRLVTREDFATITKRTPGVEIGRVEVLPNYHPDFGGGEVPGAVTLMLIPKEDPAQPDAPLPRRPFLDAVCRWLDPRRLVTTEVLLRGPEYRGIWISIGIKVAAGFNDSEVCDAVKRDVLAFLAPLDADADDVPNADNDNGWKLGKSVVALEIAAVSNRTRGVEFVQEDVILADANGVIAARLDMTGLQLPRVLGIRVVNGPAASLDELRGGGGSSVQAPSFVQIPKLPEECG